MNSQKQQFEVIRKSELGHLICTLNHKGAHGSGVDSHVDVTSVVLDSFAIAEVLQLSADGRLELRARVKRDARNRQYVQLRLCPVLTTVEQERQARVDALIAQAAAIEAQAVALAGATEHANAQQDAPSEPSQVVDTKAPAVHAVAPF